MSLAQLGKGVWADVHKGAAPDGSEVALKMLRPLKKGNFKPGDGKPWDDAFPPRNPEEQMAENVIECKLHEWLAGVATAGDAGCALVPKILGFDGTNAAFEFVDAMSLEDYLRKTDRSAMDPQVLETTYKVLCVVVVKVLTLMTAFADAQFSHRDLNDGNIMLRVKSDAVGGLDDVDVWLFDFGKSMAMVDGKMVSGGMWDMEKKPFPAVDDASYDSCRISVFNTTTDTVRVVSCIIQDLIRSYKEEGVGKDTAPSGETRAFLEANVPFGATLAAWLAHTKAKLGDEEFGKKWKKFLDEGKRATKGQSGNQDFLDFATQPAFPIMIAYYTFKDEADWCKEMLPESIIEACDAILSPATGE